MTRQLNVLQHTVKKVLLGSYVQGEIARSKSIARVDWRTNTECCWIVELGIFRVF